MPSINTKLCSQQQSIKVIAVILSVLGIQITSMSASSARSFSLPQASTSGYRFNSNPSPNLYNNWHQIQFPSQQAYNQVTSTRIGTNSGSFNSYGYNHTPASNAQYSNQNIAGAYTMGTHVAQQATQAQQAQNVQQVHQVAQAQQATQAFEPQTFAHSTYTTLPTFNGSANRLSESELNYVRYYSAHTWHPGMPLPQQPHQ